MYSKFKRSLELFKACFSVFKGNARLLIFPLFNLLPVLIILSFFLVLLFAGQIITDTSPDGVQSIAFNGDDIIKKALKRADHILANFPNIAFIAIYLVMMFIATFINVAFYSEILKAINGQTVSIFRGFQTATKKIKAIFLWSLLTGIVGVIIRFLAEQLDFFGRWIMGLVGIAWSVVTVFAIPVLIREESQSNPVNYLKYSAKLIKKTWGEGVIGFLTITIFTRVLILAFFFTPIILGSIIAASGFKVGLWVIVVGALIALFLSFVVIYLQSLMTNIFRCTLYVYASEGVVPTAFSEDVLIDSFKLK